MELMSWYIDVNDPEAGWKELLGGDPAFNSLDEAVARAIQIVAEGKVTPRDLRFVDQHTASPDQIVYGRDILDKFPDYDPNAPATTYRMNSEEWR
jgi:hypothetical protein